MPVTCVPSTARPFGAASGVHAFLLFLLLLSLWSLSSLSSSPPASSSSGNHLQRKLNVFVSYMTGGVYKDFAECLLDYFEALVGFPLGISETGYRE